MYVYTCRLYILEAVKKYVRKEEQECGRMKLIDKFKRDIAERFSSYVLCFLGELNCTVITNYRSLKTYALRLRQK